MTLSPGLYKWSTPVLIPTRVTLDAKGNILCKTAIAMQTGAALDGRALAQTAVTLQMNDITQPAN